MPDPGTDGTCGSMPSLLVTILAETGTKGRFLLHLLVPFTVTKPVTNQEMSKAVASRDAEFVFGNFYDPLITDSTIHRPDSALESPWKRLGVHESANFGCRSADR